MYKRDMIISSPHFIHRFLIIWINGSHVELLDLEDHGRATVKIEVLRDAIILSEAMCV
jgi:hypothetical protein